MILYGLRLWFFFAWLHLQKVTDTRVAVVSRSEWLCSDVALAALRICSCRGNVPGTSVLGQRVHLVLLSGLLGLYSDVGSNLSEFFSGYFLESCCTNPPLADCRCACLQVILMWAIIAVYWIHPVNKTVFESKDILDGGRESRAWASVGDAVPWSQTCDTDV